jgi:hypothetical protein
LLFQEDQLNLSTPFFPLDLLHQYLLLFPEAQLIL